MLANLDPKMANLAPVWEASWLIFRILSAILAKIAEVLKRASLWRSGYKLESRAVGLEALGSYVGAMLGHLGAILEQLGDKMERKSAKMIQDSAQERRDEARYSR